MAGVDAVLRSAAMNHLSQNLFADWVLANYIDAHPDLHGNLVYQYTALDVHVQPESTWTAYPVTAEGTVHQFAADYVELETEHDLLFEFQGQLTTRVIPNTSHSGRYQWWSNRGDNSDMTLTRAFDLCGLSSATLEAWLWYDIEEDWDYAYVEASIDGGHTWTILSGTNTVTRDGIGTRYGPGYTGSSSQVPGAQDGWIEESFDLTPFTGQVVRLRFEYLTDDAVHTTGLAVDDISIPELGYSHDAETGDGGWEAHGFVRHDNRLKQRYRVYWMPVCAPLRIHEVPLDEMGRGSAAIRIGRAGCSRATLVIAAATPHTTEVAPYRYTLTPMQVASQSIPAPDA
jgi:hypothetical protein